MAHKNGNKDIKLTRMPVQSSSTPGNPNNDDRQGGDDGGDVGIVTKTKPKTKKPSLYKVLLLNDDYFFNKDINEATEIMLHVHQNGVGICGVFTFEVAETKVTQVIDLARQHQHPLQCTMEKE